MIWELKKYFHLVKKQYEIDLENLEIIAGNAQPEKLQK
jgi:hypothetical protein